VKQVRPGRPVALVQQVSQDLRVRRVNPGLLAPLVQQAVQELPVRLVVPAQQVLLDPLGQLVVLEPQVLLDLRVK